MQRVARSGLEITHESTPLAHVLIVDDNLLIRHLLREILTDGGHTVVGEAKNGLEAPMLVRDLNPDVITLDLVMPGRAGLPTLKHLMMINHKLPVVVCSAFLNENHVIAALKLGAKGFIVKPFDRLAVLAAVSGALKESRVKEPRAASANEPAPPVQAIAPATEPELVAAVLAAVKNADEHREFARVNTSMRVVLEPRGGVLDTITVNVSGSGMLLATGALELDDSVAFKLHLLDGGMPVTGTARVVRFDERGRAALAFEYLTVLDHERLTDYVREHQAPALAHAW